jgi:hypothetical protein
LLAPGARAQSADEATRAAASALGYAGVEAFQAGDFSGASEQLEKAYAVLQVPSLGLWSARALVKTGRLVQASKRYLEVTRLDVVSGNMAIQEQARRNAAVELAELEKRIPRASIKIVGAGSSQVSLTMDGAPVTRFSSGETIPLDPGRRLIVARHGEQTIRRELVVAEGQREAIELHFNPLPGDRLDQSPDSPFSTLGWVAIASGGASLAVGAAFGISALLDRRHFASSDSCDLDRNTCAAGERERVDAYNTKRSVSGIALTAGGILAAGGMYLVFFHTAPAADPPSVGLAVAPQSIAVHGRF